MLSAYKSAGDVIIQVSSSSLCACKQGNIALTSRMRTVNNTVIQLANVLTVITTLTTSLCIIAPLIITTVLVVIYPLCTRPGGPLSASLFKEVAQQYSAGLVPVVVSCFSQVTSTKLECSELESCLLIIYVLFIELLFSPPFNSALQITC